MKNAEKSNNESYYTQPVTALKPLSLRPLQISASSLILPSLLSDRIAVATSSFLSHGRSPSARPRESMESIYHLNTVHLLSIYRCYDGL